MAKANKRKRQQLLIKVVYFDEQSASDYLDITAGGKSDTTTKEVQDRTSKAHAEVQAKLMAKLSWLPFFGASSETGVGIEASRTGQSILSKTLSNTILTDYLEHVQHDERVQRIRGLKMTVPRDSLAFMKMYTPYMVIAKTEDSGVDLARLDEALAAAKGYYELLGSDSSGKKLVLRFNIKAFRNNYGLTDLSRMNLAFYGVRVGNTTEASLNMQSEMGQDTGTEPNSALDLVDGPPINRSPLDVYDVVLAGVEDDS